MADTALRRVSEAVRHAEASQATLNAFISIDHTGATEQASAVDHAGARGPLAGVPIGLKDLIDQKGRVTTCGSAFYRHLADSSAPVVKRLEGAGGAIIGKTGLHEWAFGFSSENPHFGPVRNPWDLQTSVGGSSGGSAAAVAAGITPLAIGTDTGGSIRVPAALCGVYGLKVTHGRIPLDGVFPLVPSVDTVGPLADSLELLDAGYRVLSADTTRASAVDLLRLGVPEPWVGRAPMSDEAREVFESALSRLEDMGHEVERVLLPEMIPPGEIRAAIANEVVETHRVFRSQGRPYGDDVAERIADAEKVTAAEIEHSRIWQQQIREEFRVALESYDYLVTPTVPVRRKTIGVDGLMGRHYGTVLSWFTSLVNQALLPAIALPLVGSGAPPLSLQLIGRPLSEVALIAAARAFESAGLVGFTPPMRGYANLSSG